MDGRDITAAASAMAAALRPHTTVDWTVPAGSLDWTCRATAAHIAHDLLAYACQLTARPSSAYLPLDLTVRPNATTDELLTIASACAGLLAAVVDAADPRAVAWHWGPCDRSGFAAMGVAEILLHTGDIARGLGIDWSPPGPLCAAVLDRLFPDAPPGDPAAVLLWCTGRADLPGRPRRTSWTWQAARPS